MMSKQKSLLYLSITLIFIVIIVISYGYKSSSTSNDDNTVDTTPVAINPTNVNIIPLILYTSPSKENRVAIKMQYNILTKKVEMESTNLFTIGTEDSYSPYYQWDGKDKLFLSKKAINTTGNFLVRNELSNQHTTRILELNGIIYKAYDYEKGVTLENSNKTNEKLNIDLVKEIEGGSAFSPLLIYGNEKEISILVHYYHPSKILKTQMISGLLIVKIIDEKISINEIDLKDQCCISNSVQPTLINNNIFLNALNRVDKLSINDYSIAQYKLYDSLKNEIKSEPSFKDNDEQPLIGKVGDILLLCYAKSYNADIKYYLWGIQNNKVVFKISTSNNNIFDDTSNIIFTTNGAINKILLPNDLSN